MATRALFSRFVLVVFSIPSAAPTVRAQSRDNHQVQQTVQEMAAVSAAVSPGLTLTVRQNDKELVLTFGPFNLPAHSGHHGGILQLTPRWITIPNEAWLHGYSVELRDKNSAKVPSTVLHHVNVIATQHRELFSNIMLRIAAASSQQPAARARPCTCRG